MNKILLIAKMSFRESIRNKWVLNFSLGFALLAFLFSYIGSSEMATFSSFDRTSATLLNMMMLFIPLLGFTLGAQSIAGDREGGGLMFLLSQPISKGHYFWGKYLGCIWALSLSVTIGLAVAAVGVGLSGSDKISSFIILWISALFFITVCVSIGMIFSVFAANRGRAMGIAIFSWLGFSVLSDLGLMAMAQVLRLRSEAIVALTLFNPVEVFKILTIRMLSSNLEILGMGGLYLDTLWGAWLSYLLIAWLCLFSLIAILLARWIFSLQDEVLGHYL